MEYGIALRKQDTQLLAGINTAIRELKAEGKLREIFERWNLWTPMMADWSGDFRESAAAPSSWESYLASRAGTKGPAGAPASSTWAHLPLLIPGSRHHPGALGPGNASWPWAAWGMTLTLTRLYGPRPLSLAAIAYIELFRGTPLLIQLFIIFYGLPAFGIKLPPFAAAVLGLGMNYSAYEAENYRAGLLAVPKGQMEASWPWASHAARPCATSCFPRPCASACRR